MGALSQAASAFRERLATFLGFSHNGARDMYSQFGYPQVIAVQDLFALYQRGGIANRLVKAPPQATWREWPLVHDEDGGTAEDSPFVKEWEDFCERHNVLHYMERVDRLAGIGRYATLFMGFAGNAAPDQPRGKGKAPLLFLSPYSELNSSISTWEQNSRDERFGMPLVYNLQFGNFGSVGGVPAQRTSLNVHYSRLLHVAEGLEEDDVFGLPKLVPVYNHLKDLEKVVGSSAETFWYNSRPGLGLFADKDATLSETAVADMKQQAEDFEHQLRRIIAMQGVTAQQFQSQVADPQPNVDALLDLIAGTSGIPKRILVGSERGELASSQDENNWAARIDERRKNYASPTMLKPFIQTMIDTGNLPQPKGEFWIEWPDHEVLSPEANASIAMNKSLTLKNYATAPGSELIVPETEFREKFLGLDPEPDGGFPEPDEAPIDETNPEVLDQFGQPVQPPANDQAKVVPLAAVANRRNNRGKPPRRKTNASPRTLYVRRDVVNAKEIIDWAKSQGFESVLLPSEMHVTIVYSRSRIDWMKIDNTWNNGDSKGQIIVPAGGPRIIDRLGPKKEAVVLLFNCSELSWRHCQIKELGASWDYPEYQPHITLSYNGENLDIDSMEPYRGPIILGPEIFEEVTEGYDAKEKAI